MKSPSSSSVIRVIGVNIRPFLAQGQKRRSAVGRKPTQGPCLRHWFLFQAVDNLKIGLFVPGSVLTPTGQVSFPARRAARSFWQNSSSCSRFIRTLRSSSAPSETASFHLIMRPPSPLVHLRAFPVVAEERGFLNSRALKLITQRRFFCGGSLLLSGRVIHLDGDTLILEPHSSGHHVPRLRV